jgi:hypothetical protein
LGNLGKILSAAAKSRCRLLGNLIFMFIIKSLWALWPLWLKLKNSVAEKSE